MSILANPEAIEAVRRALRRRAGAGRDAVRSQGLLDHLASDRAVGSRLAARSVLERLRNAGEIECSWIDGVGPDGMVRLRLPEPPEPPQTKAWRLAVDAHAPVGHPCHEHLLALLPALGDWPQPFYGELVEEVLRLTACSGTDSGYRLSASGHLASSKLLASLPRAALIGLGIPPIRLRDPSPYLIVATPQERIEATVLLENPGAFEAAIEATAGLPVAWLSVYGFGISRTDGAGARLVEALAGSDAPGRSDGPILLQRSGPPVSLNELLSAPLLAFSGDLDHAGLRIYVALRSVLPNLLLSRLYAPLAALLAAGGGHPYASLTGEGKPRQAAWGTNEPLIGALLTLCRKRAADQEYVRADAIRNNCLAPLDLKDIPQLGQPHQAG